MRRESTNSRTGRENSVVIDRLTLKDSVAPSVSFKADMLRRRWPATNRLSYQVYSDKPFGVPWMSASEDRPPAEDLPFNRPLRENLIG